MRTCSFKSALIVYCLLTCGVAIAEPTAEEWARVINLSGRQRMLTQKMTKEALLVHLSVDADQNLLNLRETTSLFDRTLRGLKDGDADLELPGAQNAEIRAQLDKVETVWAKVAPLFDDELSGQDLTADQLATLATENVTLLTEMNRGVGMFELAAK
jgi:hypothetical protein